jgi:hypothetical protein
MLVINKVIFIIFQFIINKQDAIRETDMNGQIEGLEIGGEAISLWNYKKAGGIKV